MPLIQLFYVSRASQPCGEDSIQPILISSRRNNQRDDVTGCLLFSGRYFAQVLEGRSEVTVDRLDRISADRRHVDFRLLVKRPITRRQYAGWVMGCLYDLQLEDELAALLLGCEATAERIAAIMDRMNPDTVMGALA